MTRSNNKQPNSSTLSIESKADIYLQLSRLEETGVPTQQAFELLQQSNPKYHKQLQQLQAYLKSGKSITDSGFRSGVFNVLDKDLLHAGENSGNLAAIYKQLSNYYAQKSKRIKKVKSKSYLPLFILVLSIFIQPIPDLVQGEISGLDYVFSSVGLLFKISIIFYLTINLFTWLTQGFLQFLGLKNLLYSLQLKIPIFSSWLIEKNINEMLRSLGLMLSAGMVIGDALPKAIRIIKQPMIKANFHPSIAKVQQGEGLSGVFSRVDLMDNHILQLILAAESSGTLVKTLLHLSVIETEKIELKEDFWVEWVPRIFYILVCIKLAYSMITGYSPLSI